MIGVFLLAFFGGMIVLGLPVVGCIVLSSSTIPLLNSAAPISFSSTSLMLRPEILEKWVISTPVKPFKYKLGNSS